MGHHRPLDLRWSDVDPTTHALSVDDVAATRAAVVAALSKVQRPAGKAARRGEAERPTNGNNDWRAGWEQAIDDVIVARHGPWACGWRWSRGEGSIGGGVVRRWCCEAHSVVGSVDDIATRAVGGLEDWHDWLAYLHKRFAMLALHTDDVDARLRFAITQLLAEVAEATDAEDAWYGHAEQVLCWYLESQGASPSRADSAVGHAVSGRFQSWCAPAPEVTDEIAQAIAAGIDIGALRVLAKDDHLAQHRLVRTRVAWKSAPTIAAHDDVDGHARFIDDVDMKRDGERATRMHAALRATRQSANGGMLVDLDMLRGLHAIAVPDVDTRSGPAWAKQGHERYGITDTLLADFTDALGDADDVDVPVIARAARAYLDVCFFHAFVDGNGRAARLIFDFILAREGIVLADVDPIFRHPIAAGDVDAASAFLSLCSTIAQTSARRATSSAQKSKESGHGL